MGEPPLLLHDWFAAVAPSTLAGDRELAIVLYGRVEANPGVVDDRPSALQLVKRLGTDAFRTGTADEARTVKLVGVLARERAVAAGVDEVVINTFKMGISPHYEFLLRAAREQKPHKVNLRAAFPPPARSAVPEPTPVHAPTPSRKPRSLTPSLLDLGSDYQRPAGAPGSMHELAEGLRRARQLRRPLSAQRVADKALEPRTLPDRDAGWSPARKQPVEVPKEAPRNAADRSTPQLVEREHPVPVETSAVEEAAQPNRASRAVDAESSIPEVDKREVDTKEVSQPLATTKEQKSGSKIGEGASADVGPATAPALIQIDCRPKSVKQALAVTVLRFFLSSKSEAAAVTSTSAPASVAQRVPSQRTGPVEPEAIVAPTRPRRLSEPISRFQANMASLLSLSEQLSQQATERAAADAPVAAPALAVQAPPEEIAADEAPMELDDKARDSAAEEHAQETPVSAANGAGTVEQGPAPAVTDAEDFAMKAVAEPSSQAAKAALVDREQAPEIEKVTPAEAATESAEPAILKPRPASLSRVEPPSSDRHSSLDPMPVRSSQGFSSLYSDESDHEANDSADATAHEISAFLERDLASSVVDEEDFADRSARPPPAAEQKPETVPAVEVVAQAETGTTEALPIEHIAEKSSPEHVREASRPPPSRTAQPLEQTAQHATNEAVAEPGLTTPLQGERAAPAPVSSAVQAAEAPQAGSDSQRPASPLPQTISTPRIISPIPPATISQIVPGVDELPTAGPSGSQEVLPGREADPKTDGATSTDPTIELARPKSAEPVLQEAVEIAPPVEPIATEMNGSTAAEEPTSMQVGFTVQQQVDYDDTYYAPLEDKSMYFPDAHSGEEASLDVPSEVKREEAGPDEQAHLAAAAFESSFGGPFVYQGEISVEETFDPAAVEKVYANDPALQDDLDGITDRGVLEALAALRSSPAVSVTNETTPRQPLRKSGSKRTTPRRPRSTRTSDSQNRAAPTTTPPVPNNGVASSAGSSPTKRRWPPVDDFILEIFPLKSPRSPKKRSQPEKRSEKRPESPPHAPVASTSKVTLDEPAADRTPPPASNGLPKAAPVKPVEPVVGASRSPTAAPALVPVARSLSLERVDAGRRASNDYESDSDDPLAAPARPKKKRVSNGIPKQTAKRSRPLLERQSQLSEEESQDSDRAVARELLPAGRAPPKPAEPETQVARPTPPPAKRRLSEGTDSGMKPEPKRPRTTPSTEPRRRPSLAGKGQPVQRRNGVPRIPPPPHGEISSPLPLAASRDGSGALDRSAARTAPSTGQSEHHGSRKRRHSDLVSPPLDDDDDDDTHDARPSHRRAAVVAGHSEMSKARTVPRSSQGRTPVQAPWVSFRSAERTAAARDGKMRDRRSRSTTSSPNPAADGHPEVEEDEAEPVQAGEEAEPVEVNKTPAKARKRAKKRKPLNMPRYKGKKRAMPRQQQARPRSPTPEETPSPEPTPPPQQQQQQQNVCAHAPAVKRKQKNSVGGGSSRGWSQRARQAYDEGEWEG